MAKNTVIAVGVALALAVPGASALAAGGGQGRAHHATPPPGTHGRTGDVPGIHGAAQGRGAAQSQRVRQFEGVIVAVDQDSLALRVQGSAGVTVTVDLSTTGTRVTADDVVTTTAALVSGEQAHVAATTVTINGVTTYTAVRIAIQRREADTEGTTD